MSAKLLPSVINLHFYVREFFNPSAAPSPVKFGTSGHRGKIGKDFCVLHTAAVAQAVADFHKNKNISAPVLLGGDTRILSATGARLCAEVLAGNGIECLVSNEPLPTPVFSLAIKNGKAAGALNLTASHNPPEDMGIKYNPANGGPAGKEITTELERLSNYYLQNPGKIRSIVFKSGEEKKLINKIDLRDFYLSELEKRIDFEAIRQSGIKILSHPLGGTARNYFRAIKEKYIPNLILADETIDPAFGFIPPDHDGKIRMDPSSVYPLAEIIEATKNSGFDLGIACDTDADRFAVISPKTGLMLPNNFLCVALHYILSGGKYPAGLKTGRSIATTHLLDKIAEKFNASVLETDVGFKYFADGLSAKEIVFAGEESAGLSVYNWTAEKDGILAVMSAAEIRAKTGKDVSDIYSEISAQFGAPVYKRTDIPAGGDAKNKFLSVLPSVNKLTSLAGEKVKQIRTSDGVKIYLENSWLLARVSGTEPIIKFYAESFTGQEHLNVLISEGKTFFGI